MAIIVEESKTPYNIKKNPLHHKIQDEMLNINPSPNYLIDNHCCQKGLKVELTIYEFTFKITAKLEKAYVVPDQLSQIINMKVENTMEMDLWTSTHSENKPSQSVVSK